MKLIGLISSSSNARFVLSIYYNRELDLLVPKDLANELKEKIEDSIGVGQFWMLIDFLFYF